MHSISLSAEDVDKERQPLSALGGAVFLVMYLVYCALSEITLTLNGSLTNGAVFWPPAGVSFAALVLLKRRQWPAVLSAVFLAAVTTNLRHGYDVELNMLVALANTIEPLVGAVITTRLVRGRLMVPTTSLVKTSIGGVFVGPFAGALVGGLALRLVLQADVIDAGSRWFAGDMLGVIAVAPLILAWADRRKIQLVTEPLTVAAVVITWPLLLAVPLPGIWTITLVLFAVPIMSWVSLRLGIFATAVANLYTTGMLYLLATYGVGPLEVDVEGTYNASLLVGIQALIGLIAAIALLNASLAEDLVQREVFERTLRHEATHDALTGLPNRVYLAERLTEAAGAEHPHAVFLCDLDYFKNVNDTLGHHVGDQFLVTIADRLRQCLQPGEFLARFGGDEFVVIAEIDGEDGTEAIGARLMAAIAAPVSLSTFRAVQPSMSIGAANVQAGEDTDRSLSDADLALYEAKARGRGVLCCFDMSMATAKARELSVEFDFKRALDTGDIYCDYQPQFDAVTGVIVGVEALARWAHPVHGQIPPSTFVPRLEMVGRSEEFFEYVLNHSLQARRQWRDAVGWAPMVGVNLSTTQLRDRSVVETVGRWLAETGTPAESLWLEITETSLIDGVSFAAMMELHEAGVRLAIDDFGTGWSSMQRLASLPWDALKIDQSFVRNLGEGEENLKIVKAIVALGHTLGMSAVAEGVETEAQLLMLREVGCDIVQGYFTGRPISSDALADLLREQQRVATAALATAP